jgi:hypothetical protein
MFERKGGVESVRVITMVRGFIVEARGQMRSQLKNEIKVEIYESGKAFKIHLKNFLRSFIGCGKFSQEKF